MAKYLTNNEGHSISFIILLASPKLLGYKWFTFFITKLKLSLNKHEDSYMLSLLRNDVNTVAIASHLKETYCKLTIQIHGKC